MKLLLLAAAVLAISASDPAARPDPALTPGVTDPRVTKDNISRTICRPGYTKTVRPPASYTNALKRQQLAALGWPNQNPRDYEEDHFIPLEIGGNPTDPKNLWPMPYAGKWGARTKDKIETRLKREVCAGRMTLKAAQDAIRTDWIAAYQQAFGEP